MRVAVSMLAAGLFLGSAPPAVAAVTSVFTPGSSGPQGTLRVESDAADSIVVGCIGGVVEVNGAPPDTGSLDCSRVSRIDVMGGPGDNRIDLGGFAPAQALGVFRGVAAFALVDGRAGDHSIIGPSAGLTRLVGGPGSDWRSTSPPSQPMIR
jgi:hypothetical protein